MKTSFALTIPFLPFSIPVWFVSGLLCGLAYPLWVNIPTGFLMWFALVPLLLSLRTIENFKAYFFRTYPFLLVSGLICNHFVAIYGFTNWLLSCFLQTILMFMPFAIQYFFQKKMGWQKALWALPFLWTACDWLQHLVPHSFQISSIAYTQTTVIWFAQIADIFGMWGVTFWLVLVNVSLVLAIDSIEKNVRETFKVSRTWWLSFLKKWSFQGILFFGLPLLYAFWININLPDGQKVKIALVQTNEDSYAKIDDTLFNKRIATVMRLANEAAKSKPDLIVLPESALPLPILSNANAFAMLRYYVGNWGASLAVGFPHYPDTTNDSKLFNSALVLTPQLARAWDSLGVPTSELKVYQKQNPLPIVEYMPYSFNNGIGLNGSEILRGYEPYVFSFPNKKGDEIKTSTTICWEQMFPETQAELVEKGAMFLIQMNNDGWFGNSTGQSFLLNINRLRAIENRRSIARASNTGISAFIDPFGRVYKSLKTHTEAVDTEGVVLNIEWTVFSRYKDWFPKFCALITFGFIGFGYKKMIF